jgi:hypothetical protein
MVNNRGHLDYPAVSRPREEVMFVPHSGWAENRDFQLCMVRVNEFYKDLL